MSISVAMHDDISIRRERGARKALTLFGWWRQTSGRQAFHNHAFNLTWPNHYSAVASSGSTMTDTQTPST
jgi:hypothetical protein